MLPPPRLPAFPHLRVPVPSLARPPASALPAPPRVEVPLPPSPVSGLALFPQVHKAEETCPEQEPPGDPPRGHPLPARDPGWGRPRPAGVGGSDRPSGKTEHRRVTGMRGLLQGWPCRGAFEEKVIYIRIHVMLDGII